MLGFDALARLPLAARLWQLRRMGKAAAYHRLARFSRLTAAAVGLSIRPLLAVVAVAVARQAALPVQAAQADA